MAISQITTRDTKLEKGDLGKDLTWIVNDSGTLKVEIGSIVEYGGSLFEVITGRETPSGTAQDGAYLFFDGSAFKWSNTAGDYDAALGGIYNGSDERECRFRLKSATTWDMLVMPESPDVAFEGDVQIDGGLNVDGGITGDLTGDVTGNVTGNVTGDVSGDITGNLWGWMNNGTADVNVDTNLSTLRTAMVNAGIPNDTIVPSLGYVGRTSSGQYYVTHALKYDASNVYVYWTLQMSDLSGTITAPNVVANAPLQLSTSEQGTWAVRF